MAELSVNTNIDVDEDESVKWVRDNLSPGDVFEEGELGD